ncbi:MFS transporter [Nonomuraea phyllanthi]|uniref:MFS transporter n=1 Tax=Nonomuraea phyllanthi TaxID=2219224 RepID=A0A5C4VRF2_9ACTN|nr:MFS transporter [Nonomuraea phyllanthi]KAB8189741.1 MFS transporter [Nonomuraea phyllanthi]
MRAQLPFRLARTAAFTAVCVTLAALAHVVGGGSAPTPQATGLGLAGVSALGLALCGRERSPAAINVVLMGAQLGLHELFAGEGAGYFTLHGLFSSPGAAAVHTHAQGGLAVSSGMLLTHMTATLITGLWLARGEAALWSLLRLIGRRLVPALPAAVSMPAVLVAAPVVMARVVPVQPDFRHRVARRGPPLPA